MIAKTPEPPYYAVIFTTIKSDDLTGYDEMNARMFELAQRQKGFLGIESGRGDEYHEIYLGLNKYLYGHKLKWQTGIQYASMDDSANDGGQYDGWGITTGLRASW